MLYNHNKSFGDGHYYPTINEESEMPQKAGSVKESHRRQWFPPIKLALTQPTASLLYNFRFSFQPKQNILGLISNSDLLYRWL